MRKLIIVLSIIILPASSFAYMANSEIEAQFHKIYENEIELTDIIVGQYVIINQLIDRIAAIENKFISSTENETLN